MRRRLPKFIRVLGVKVAIDVEDDLVHDNGDEDDPHRFHRAYGVYIPEFPVITLDRAMGPERTKATLVHESLHAMLNVAQMTESSSEEELVSRFAPVLLNFIRTNKGVIAYLQED